MRYTQTLYRIEYPDLNEHRIEPFWRFFDKFYAGVNGLLDVKAGADASLFSLCDDRIGLAAYNSCHGNDRFAFHGMIRRESIARSHLDLEDIGEVYDLCIAVWHHSIDGPPYHTDYRDLAKWLKPIYSDNAPINLDCSRGRRISPVKRETQATTLALRRGGGLSWN